MHKKGGWILWFSIGLVFVLIVFMFLFAALYQPVQLKAQFSPSVLNPVSGLSTQEAVNQFSEDDIYYFLYIVKAYELHNIPLSSDAPKIQFYTDSDSYNAEISNGSINVYKGEIRNEDLIIKTTKSEMVKMLQDNSYISQSFANGASKIDLVASKSVLFGKGYLNLYTTLSGKSITGNVIRIYGS